MHTQKLQRQQNTADGKQQGPVGSRIFRNIEKPKGGKSIRTLFHRRLIGAVFMHGPDPPFATLMQGMYCLLFKTPKLRLMLDL
jgi:hypothetical protein